MTRQEIIELANQLSERKGERVLNLESLFRFVCQDIAKRQRFWWRRGYVTFNLAPGTKTYDMTALPGGSPALTEISVEEITKFTLILSPNPYTKLELVPVFDPQTFIDMAVNTQLSAPGRYTLDANDYKTLRIDPPDMAYAAYLVFWAMPNPASDSTNDIVPLIPAWGHNAIVEGMKAYIFEFAYGAENPKAVRATERYEQAVQDLMSKKQFDPNYRSQLSLSEDAVRST
jgi:hypothetical protein